MFAPECLLSAAQLCRVPSCWDRLDTRDRVVAWVRRGLIPRLPNCWRVMF